MWQLARGQLGSLAANGPALFFDFSGASLPSGITFTRSSSGTYTDVAGVLQTATTDTARFNYSDTSIGTLLGLLIEPAATNLIQRSNAFTTAPWSALNGITVTAAAGTSPDGTNNAFRNQANSSTFGGNVQSLTLSAVPYAFSGWVKRNVGSNQSFSMGLTLATLSGKTATSAWQRFTANNTPVAATANAFFTTANGATAYDVLVYGVQVELGSVNTSYIVTAGGTATRAADSCAFTIPSGLSTLRYTFDDASTQDVAVSAGAYTVPTNLNRPNIKSIRGIV